MPLALSFEKDIFISYCHADNVDAMGEGWIELFDRALRNRLVQLLGARTPGEELRIWRDPNLQGNDEFAGVLSEQLRQVALVVSVMSPSYVKSEWCIREIDEFCKAAAARGGVVLGNKGRILKVLKDPVPRDDHPEVLKGQIGYPFYKLEPGRSVPIPFTLTKGDETIALAKRVIDDLAYSIIETLQAVNQAVASKPGEGTEPVAKFAPAPAAVAATPAAGGGTVYLAESDLDDERQQVRRALEDVGITVLPAGDLPLRKPDEFKAQARQALAQCNVAVHMVAGSRSTMLRGEVDDNVFLQNQIAADMSAERDLPRLVWLPPGLVVDPDDAYQQRFIEQLKRDEAVRRGAEVLSVPLQDLIRRVHETLKKQAQAQARPPQPAFDADASVQVYLITDEADIEGVDPLRQHLIDQGFDVIERMSDDSLTPQQKQDDHKNNLVDCEAAIVYIGAAGENWTKTLLSEIQKANGWRDPDKPLRWRAIYLGPPTSAYKAKYVRKTGFESLDGREGLATAALQPLLDRIRAGAAGQPT